MAPADATLYVVATPIGNLDDLSGRARRILADVAVVAAEDTRRTGKLLSAFNISTDMIACHDHNEDQVTAQLIGMLVSGQSVAIVSDAGTPLISDPGFPLIRECIARDISVVPVPGPSAVITAISVAGIPAHRFTFEGFIPPRSQARRTFLQTLADESRTMILFEAPHRVRACLQALEEVMGSARQMAICRELTKSFEQVRRGTISNLISDMDEGVIPAKGEFVLVVAGRPAGSVQPASDKLLSELLSALPPAKVAAILARVTGEAREAIYQRALLLKVAQSEQGME